MCRRRFDEDDFRFSRRFRHHRPFRHSILGLLERLSPGTCIVIQFDCQPPVTAVFHDIFPCEDTISVSGLDGFDDCFGVTYIAIDRINAVSVVSNCPKPC
ncbi:hypothetical protein BK704_11410 [[Bacillus thuringiensis] serovar konkukian]|nr:hypothetical protein [Bacillus thuringiensis]OUB11892.1 hypothetical protein BK704_11410 [[Bacillus thuringiensis] serovar konkukian]